MGMQTEEQFANDVGAAVRMGDRRTYVPLVRERDVQQRRQALEDGARRIESLASNAGDDTERGAYEDAASEMRRLARAQS